MSRSNLTVIAMSLALLMVSTAGMAGGALVINDNMSRRAPGSSSGSDDTVEANCPADPTGNAWQDATAKLRIIQVGEGSSVTLKLRNAVPNTLFTVWLRLRGKGPDGSAIGDSPMTGGGATPLATGTMLDQLLRHSPPFPGTPNPPDGFFTDHRGYAYHLMFLDFPVVGGAYPFHRASDEAVQDLINAGSGWPLERRPSPIVNPADPDIEGSFLLRVVSHCVDQLGHGLSAGKREAWFQYP